MSDEAHSTNGGYEFTADQNLTIGHTGSRSRWWGMLMIAFAVLFGGLGVFVMAVDGFDATGAVVWALITMLPLYIGAHFLRAGRSLRSVVTTEGHDVTHLMQALGSLGSALGVQVAAMSVWLVLLVLGVAMSMSSMGHTRDRAYLAAQKSDLRNLVSVQEIYFADSGEDGEQYTYASSLDDLNFVSSEGVTLTLVLSDPGSWSARASHAVVDMECVVYIGDGPTLSTSQGTTPSQEGEISCDG